MTRISLWRVCRILVFTLSIGFILLTGCGGNNNSTPAVSFSVKSPWIPNARVNALLLDGNTLYLGGSFTRVGEYSGHGLVLDSTTGHAAAGVAQPVVNGSVLAAVDTSDGGVVLGGDFTSVNGTQRRYLAKLKSDGSLDNSFNPSADAEVTALARQGATIYVAGAFATVGGATRHYLAALDDSLGTVTSWDPGFSSSTTTPFLSLFPTASYVYVGGSGFSKGGTTYYSVGRVDTSSGAADTSWIPQLSHVDTSAASTSAIAVVGSTVYVGGDFDQVGGTSRSSLAALKASDGSLDSTWAITGVGALGIGLPGTVSAIAVSGSTLYIGGDFNGIVKSGGPGGGGKYLSAVDTSGTISSWNPNGDGPISMAEVAGSSLFVAGSFSTFGSQGRSRLASFDLGTGSLQDFAPTLDASVRSAILLSSGLFVGGDFTLLEGTTRNGLAAVDITSGTLTDWNPSDSDAEITSLIEENGTMYVAGSFTSMGGSSRTNLAAFDLKSGQLTSWTVQNDGAVNGMVSDGQNAFLWGDFSQLAGQSRAGLGAVSLSAGTLSTWAPTIDAGRSVLSAAISDGSIFLGGTFTSMSGQSRNYLASVDLATGTASSWNPNPDGFVYSVAASGGTIFVGGSFANIASQSSPGIASFDTSGNFVPFLLYASGRTVDFLGLIDQTLYVGGYNLQGLTEKEGVASIDAGSAAYGTLSAPIVGQIASALISRGYVFLGGFFELTQTSGCANLCVLDGSGALVN